MTDHVPQWPPYSEKSYPLRVLAFEDGGRITTEHGASFTWTDWQELVTLMHEHNLLVLTAAMVPIVDHAIGHEKTQIRCSKDGFQIHCISARQGRKLRHVVPASSWHVYSVADLATVRKFMRHCEVGDRLSASATGQAIARKEWDRHGYPRHTLPSRRCQLRLQLHKQPARSQWFKEEYSAPKVYEYDLKNAYARHYSWHPTGTATRIVGLGDDARECKTYFQRCVVKIHRRVSLAPFGLKEQRRGWSYPTEPGTYGLKLSAQVWLWKEQAEECRRLGMTVICVGGYGWERMTDNNKSWSTEMLNLRSTAPTPAVGELVKKAIVGGIGRQDISGPTYTMIGINDDPQPGDRPVIRGGNHASSNDPLTGLYTRRTGYSYGGMAHWAIYTVMRCNLTVFRAALSNCDNLIQINFDGLVFAQTAKRGLKMFERRTYTNVRIENRRLYSDELIRTPGMPHPLDDALPLRRNGWTTTTHAQATAPE